MRYIFANHDRSSQIAKIREGIEEHRASGVTDPEGLEMYPIYDDILGQLADQYLGHWQEEVALLGLGGYGRKEMSPYSDIDLLFLRPEDAPEGIYRGIRSILRLLWDSKVELGHSVRTIEECKIEARRDLAVLTSLLDTRFIWGDDRIYRMLKNERERLIHETDPLDFYLRIEAELLKSWSDFGHTIYLLEPYVKEGPGSLRYMQLIGWLSRIIYGCSGVDDLPVLGMSSSKEVGAVKEGLRFLSGVRTRLHFLSGRRDDRLKFEAQTVLAEQMGFNDTPERQGVERFMQEYYRHATTMELFGQEVLARARLFLRPSGGSEVKRMKLDRSFYIGAGGINRNDPDEMSLDALEMLQAFRWVVQTGSHLDIRLMDLIRTRILSLDSRWKDDPAVNARFLEIFRTRGSISKGLTAMMQTGFLERFIVEFARIRYLRLYDAYHQYTVDRHTMRVLAEIDSFGRDNREGKDSLLRTIFSRSEKPEVLYLAGLFHDIGKGSGPGHEIRGELIARPVLERIGLPPDDVEEVCFLIRSHLAMSQLAFKKDLHDEALLGRFAGNLMHKRLLDMLMLLTHADLRAVGPRGLSSWRSYLLEELYYRTLDVLEGESAEGEDLAEWVQQIKAVVRKHVPQKERGAKLDEFLAGASSRYLLDFYPGIVADHFLAVRSYLKEHGKESFDSDDIIVRKVDHLRPGYSSVTLITQDRHGLFFRISGTLSANRINILSAWSHTVGSELAVATFHVHDIPQGPLVDPDRWEKFRADMGAVIRGEVDVHELVDARRRAGGLYPRTSAPLFPLKVEIDNAASDTATIVEVYAHDRPGLLYDITRHLSSLGLDIMLAKISTEIDQAADIFYVLDENGQKVADFDRLDEIKTSLKVHLTEMEEAMLRGRRTAAI
ncbi:MAG: [protein-PII] uridylyltransferase [Deltaproteobacteria bacterium]